MQLYMDRVAYGSEITILPADIKKSIIMKQLFNKCINSNYTIFRQQYNW